MIDKIFPVFCGEYNSKKKAFEDFFGTGGLPAAPAVAVGSVERGDVIDTISFPFYMYQILLYSSLLLLLLLLLLSLLLLLLLLFFVFSLFLFCLLCP